MRRLFFILSFFLSVIISKAQITFYGLTSIGGSDNAGTVFSITPSGQATLISSLNTSTAAMPEGSLIYASDCNFYATSVAGGFNDSCTVFRCSDNGFITTMINLDSAYWGESASTGSLMQALDGNMYGMAQGGNLSFGVIFELQLNGNYSLVYAFNGTDGNIPYGSLVQTPDSNLWGLTSGGGTYHLGSIFKCTTQGVCTLMYSFDSGNGTLPKGDLCMANDGNFYGLTNMGGTYGVGTVFRFNPSGTYTKIADFNDTNGANPNGSLIQANNGLLYGLTTQGGSYNKGTLFKCTLTGIITKLSDFNDTNGANPMGTLLQASDDTLYGMTSSGNGLDTLGVVFKSSLSGGITKIFDFNDTLGGSPKYGKLIEVDKLCDEGINELKTKNEDVRVEPNPNNGKFAVDFSAEKESGETMIEIYNMLGQQVYDEMLKPVQHDYKIDLSSRPAGIYLYRVVTTSGKLIGDGKFVIEK